MTYLIRTTAIMGGGKRQDLGHTTLLPSGECTKYRAYLLLHLLKPGRWPLFHGFPEQDIKGSIMATSLVQCLSCLVSDASAWFVFQDYGGYLSIYMLPAGEENQVFACGAALSPLTDFKLYGKPHLRACGPSC